MSDSRITEAVALMRAFTDRTGLTADRPAQRYLWTDAFAVCNLLGLAHVTGDAHYSALALRLVDQVHHTLGRHRSDDPRASWISGLGEKEGEAHPTLGGLRIGKSLPERGPDAPYDERLEWDRDGQYFHYLTQWMHALDQVTRRTGQPQFNLWARELAKAAHDAFTYPTGVGPGRMYWKMSIDLKRALVPSMGQHDPLDGYVTTLQLRATAAALPKPVAGPTLGGSIDHYAALTAGGDWSTPDPLGLGGLLTDAYRVQQLGRRGAVPDARLLESLLTAALSGLEYYARSGELHQAAQYRLAFRELGLAIGLHAVERMHAAADHGPQPSATSDAARARLEALLRFLPLGDQIESFWRDPAHQRAPTWTEHRDINEVMLATSLVPEGFLVLPSMD
jgi:hypothetical protein